MKLKLCHPLLDRTHLGGDSGDSGDTDSVETVNVLDTGHLYTNVKEDRKVMEPSSAQYFLND